MSKEGENKVKIWEGFDPLSPVVESDPPGSLFTEEEDDDDHAVNSDKPIFPDDFWNDMPSLEEIEGHQQEAQLTPSQLMFAKT